MIARKETIKKALEAVRNAKKTIRLDKEDGSFSYVSLKESNDKCIFKLQHLLESE